MRMPKVRHTIAASGAALLAALAGGCRTLEVLSLPDAGVLLAPDAGLDAPGDAAPPRLAVVRVLPGHGPFSGGNVATLRGNGLGSGPLSVRFGERSIPASDVRSIDSNRLEVTVPARSPGSVDVEVSDGTSTAVLPAGYTYDPVAISPASSSPDGGVVLTLRAASALFDASTAVRIDDLACTGWSARSPTEGTCVVPPHEIGTADVTVTSRGETLVLEEAFTYESPFRSFGGLGGGPIDGVLRVLVTDDRGRPLEGAVVVAGREGAFPHQSLTGPAGTVTFAGDDVRGPMDVFASHRCFDHGGFVAINSRYVSASLNRGFRGTTGVDPSCLPVGDGGAGDGSPFGRRVESRVEGEIVFYDAAGEFETPTWDWLGVPAAMPGEERAAYVVLVGNRDLRSGDRISGLVSAFTRVTESDRGARGFRFTLDPITDAASTETTLVAFAIAGIERTAGATGYDVPFEPRVVGLSRTFRVVSDGTTAGVEVRMDSPLVSGRAIRTTAPGLARVHTASLNFDQLRPTALDTVRLHTRYAVGSLTGLGLFAITSRSGPFGYDARGPSLGFPRPSVTTWDNFAAPLGEEVALPLQPSALGSFSGARQEVLAVLEPELPEQRTDAGWEYRGWSPCPLNAQDGCATQPYSAARVREPLETGALNVPATAFLEVPRFTAPATPGEAFAADRTLRWTHAGGHSFSRVVIRSPFDSAYDREVSWYILAHPSARSVTVPDLGPWVGQGIQPLGRQRNGVLPWRVIVEVTEVPALDFDTIDLRAIAFLPFRRAALDQTNFTYEVSP